MRLASLLILLVLSASPLLAQGFHYGFDRFPRGANSLSGSGTLTLQGNALITLSPFDSNANGEIWDERALYLGIDSGSHARATTGGAPGFTDQYTAEAFFRIDNPPVGDDPVAARRGLVRIDRSGEMKSTLFVTHVDGQTVLGATLRRSGPLGYATIHGVTPLQAGQWYHVRMEVTRTTGRILLNGEEEAAFSNIVIDPVTGFDTLWIGTADGAAGAFEGALDEVSLLPGNTVEGTLDRTPTARRALHAEPSLSIESQPADGIVRLHIAAKDNLVHHILATSDNPVHNPNGSWQRVGSVTIDDATMMAQWEESLDPANVTERYYRVETEPWLDTPARTVKSVLADRQGDFDPWNQVRWADWYTDGKITRTFDIDTSVRFAKRATPWDVDLSGLPGNPPRLFTITMSDGFDIDGNGLVIDARSAFLRSQTVAQFHATATDLGAEIGNPSAFYFDQVAPLEDGQSPSQIRNLTIRGFNHALDFGHSHRRAVHVSACDLRTNAWGIFPRGTDVTVEDCDIRENFQGGFYGEYNSTRWIFRGNRFRDNNLNGGFSYADAVLDACHGYLLEGNTFLPPSATPKDSHFSVTLYRNRGEADDIREWAARDHIIRDNVIEGRNIAIEVGIRSGLINANDRSMEARSYADNNLILNNTIRDSVVGIKINSDNNEVGGNVFENVQREIVLHAVFYKNAGNLLHNQPGTQVWLWGVPSDFTGFAQYLHYQNRQERFLPKSDKLFFVRTGENPPSIGSPGTATLVVGDSLLRDDNPGQYTGNGGTPVALAVGDFARHLSGSEFAVSHGSPNSQIDSTVYYSIILYDSTGLEIDRCGRSTIPWSSLAAGNMLPDTGHILEDLNDEIIAVSSQVNSAGRRPVYVFRKGWRDPAVTLEESNTAMWSALTTGEFLTGGDGYQEIAAARAAGGSDVSIVFLKPTNPAWRDELTVFAPNLRGVVAGDFDGNAVNGDEVALLAEFTPGVFSVRFFRRGSADPIGEIAPGGASPAWASIASGAFDPARPSQSGIAVSASNSGIVTIHYLGDAEAWGSRDIPSHSQAIRRIASGKVTFNSESDPLDSFEGAGTSPEATASWGDWLAILPTRPSSQRVPLVWLNADPQDESRTHTRIVPILR
jgi:hypothetical protein